MMKSMKDKRARRPERIPAELLKNGTTELTRMLTEFFNRCKNGDNLPIN